MSIPAKLAPNFTKSLVHEFSCAIFQTVDVMKCGKLSVVKLGAVNRLAVCNLRDNYIPG